MTKIERKEAINREGQTHRPRASVPSNVSTIEHRVSIPRAPATSTLTPAMSGLLITEQESTRIPKPG